MSPATVPNAPSRVTNSVPPNTCKFPLNVLLPPNTTVPNALLAPTLHAVSPPPIAPFNVSVPPVPNALASNPAPALSVIALVSVVAATVFCRYTFAVGDTRIDPVPAAWLLSNRTAPPEIVSGPVNVLAPLKFITLPDIVQLVPANTDWIVPIREAPLCTTAPTPNVTVPPVTVALPVRNHSPPTVGVMVLLIV